MSEIHTRNADTGERTAKGAVFLLNATDEAEAESIMASLPLAKEHLLDHSYMPVSPLKPLGLLLGSPSIQR